MSRKQKSHGELTPDARVRAQAPRSAGARAARRARSGHAPRRRARRR
jgi:ribosomal protein S30